MPTAEDAMLARLVVERGLASAADVERELAAATIDRPLVARLRATDGAIAELDALVRRAGAHRKLGAADRLGALAVAAGRVAAAVPEEVALSQRALAARDIRKRLGALLVARGDLAPAVVRECLAKQGLTILACTSCGRRFNVLAADLGRPPCPECRRPLSTTSPGDPVEVEGTLVVEPPAGATPPGGQPASRSRALRLKLAQGKHLGDYEIVAEVARGGMGIVYRARQPRLSRDVALKVLLAGDGASEGMVARLYAEAQAAARLRHPNIVTVHDVGTADDAHYICMDFVEGETLDALVRRQGHFSPKRAAQIGVALADALHYAHGQGVIHRDLKPPNVMVTPDGQPVLMDFGLAKDLAVEKGLTASGTVLGTPDYMSPEQARGQGRKVDARSDVFGLGALLSHLLAGVPPFTAKTAMKTMHNVCTQDPDPPSRHNPAVPRELDAIVGKALEKSPGDRYQTAADLSADLSRWLEDLPVHAAPPGGLRRVWRRLRRDRVLRRVLVVGVGAAGLGSLLTVAWMGGGRRPVAPTPPADGGGTKPGPEPEALAEARTRVADALAEARRATIAAGAIAADRAEERAPAIEKARRRWDAVRTLLAEDPEARRAAAGEPALREAADAGARVTELTRRLSEAWVERAVARGADDERADAAYKSALADLSRAIEVDEANARAFSVRGQLRAIRTWPETQGPMPAAMVRDALFDLDKALAAEPADVGALAARALVLAHQGHREKALALCDEAAQHGPKRLEPPYVRGWTLFLESDQKPAEAARLLERAAVEMRRARELADAALEGRWSSRAAVTLARILERAGRPAEGIEVLDRYLAALAADDHSLWAVYGRYFRGYLHELTGHKDQAIADYEAVLALVPNHEAGARLNALRAR